MALPLPASWKAAIKGRAKQIRLAWQRRRYRFDEADLLRAIRAVGIEHGDRIIVHSSYDRFTGFTGKASDVIAVLKRAVGSEGQILMPTMSFTGSALDYVAKKPVFDVRRTPSRMGLITELFRRGRDVVRSMHPTHAVAIWGSDAAAMAHEHEKATTPCGEMSPYMRLFEQGGKVLFLGASIESMTFFHTLEALQEERLPFPVFTDKVYRLNSKDSEGREHVTETRLFNREWSKRRIIARLEPGLRRAGAWHQAKTGMVHVVALSTQDIVAEADRLLQQSIYCYE